MPLSLGAGAARGRLLAALGLFAIAVLPFAPALTGAFLYDDFPAILKNPRVTGGPLAQIFTTGSYWREGEVGYRPLTTLSFRANRVLFGERPAAFHATNLALHAVNTLLVAGIGLAVLGSGPGAFLAAALFAVHPAQVESVAGIAAGRAELLAAAFGFGALLLAIRGPAEPVGLARSAAVAALYLAALLSKESALPLPVLAILLRGARGATPWKHGGKEGFLLAFLGAALGFYFVHRHAALGRLAGFVPAFLDNPLAHADRAAFLPGVLRVLAEYARLLLFPLRLSADYGFDAIPLPATGATAAIVPGLVLASGIGGLAALAWRRRRSARPALLALALAATLVIPLHLVAPLPALCAERFLYFPLAFAALFAAFVVLPAAPAPLPSRRVLALAGVLLAVLAARSAARSLDWRSELRLFDSSARAQPGSARAHNVLGLAYRNARRPEGAEAEFRRALAIYPEYASALVNLANLEFERGEVKSARARYEAALAHNPHFERARWNLAVALERLGDVDAAAREYATLAAEDSTHFEARLRLGEILLDAGRTDEARRALEEALRIRPSDPKALRALGRLEK